jgi:hypothetical protein
MIAVNLVPADRRRARARRVRIRRWLWAGGMYGLALAGAFLWAQYRLGIRPDSVDARLTEVATEIQSAEQLVEALRAKFALTQKELAATRAVTDHPDWSVLLGLVSGARAGEIVLDSCELTPTDTKPGAAIHRYTLRLGGFGRHQVDIPNFVLRLEQMGLFERVTMLDSRARTDGDVEVFAFRIECSLRDSRGPNP